MGALLAALLLAQVTTQATLLADGNVGNDPATNAAVATSSLSGRFGASTVLEGLTFTVLDQPRITWANSTPASPSQVAVFDAGSLLAEARWGTTQLRLSEAFSGGEQDFSILAQTLRVDPQAPPPPPADRLPAERFLPTINSSSTLTLLQTLSRRVSASAAASFSIGGGLGHDGRTFMPLERTAGIDLRLSWRGSLEDDLSLSAQAGASDASNGGRSNTFNLMASWNRRFGPVTTGSLSLGAGVLQNLEVAQVPGTAAVGVAGTQLVPTARLAVSHALSLSIGRLLFNADGSALTAPDPLTGAAYLRGAGHVDCTWIVSNSLSFAASVAGERLLSGPLAGAWGAAGEINSAIRLRPGLSLRLAARAALITPTRLLFPDEDPLHQWTVVAGLAFDL